MRQLIGLTLILLMPFLAISQTTIYQSYYGDEYYGPLHTFFTTDGTSTYGDMYVDSIDILDIYTKDVKLTYDEDCRVKTIDYREDLNTNRNHQMLLEYGDTRLPIIVYEKIEFDDGGIDYDTTWFNASGQPIESHMTNSEINYYRYSTWTYDEEGRTKKVFHRRFDESNDSNKFLQHEFEYIYVSENEIVTYEFYMSDYRAFDNSIDTLIRDTKRTTIYDNNRIIESTTESASGTVVRVVNRYENDILLESEETYNGTVRERTEYSYSDIVPECTTWTNDLWDIQPNQEVETVIVYNRWTGGELVPNSEMITAKNEFGKVTFYSYSTADAIGNWIIDQKSLRHYNADGSNKYSVVFDLNTGNGEPKLLYTYDHSIDRRTKIETREYLSDTKTWSEPVRETISVNNKDGRLESRIVTEGNKQDVYTWDYTDFGAPERITNPSYESNYYYSEKCDGLTDLPEKLLVYPNPVIDILTISDFYPRINYTARIFRSDGKLMESYNFIRDDRLDVSALVSGVYILWITDDENNAVSQKFVKI